MTCGRCVPVGDSLFTPPALELGLFGCLAFHLSNLGVSHGISALTYFLPTLRAASHTLALHLLLLSSESLLLSWQNPSFCSSSPSLNLCSSQNPSFAPPPLLGIFGIFAPHKTPPFYPDSCSSLLPLRSSL